MSSYSYGSIVVDDAGIRKRGLPLIGKGFKFSWDELGSWKVSQSVLASMDTGKDEPLTELIELQGSAGSETIDRRTAGEMLDALVAYLRLRCPEKETISGGSVRPAAEE